MTSDLLNARHVQFACLVKCVLLNSWWSSLSHTRNVARAVPEDRQPDVLRKVHTQGRDVVLRKRYKAAGGKKAISVQRLNILAIGLGLSNAMANCSIRFGGESQGRSASKIEQLFGLQRDPAHHSSFFKRLNHLL